MKLCAKSLASAGLIAAAITAVPAAAQVNGIATATPEAVFVRSQARVNAYQQIEQTYAAQIQQVRTLRQEMNTLQQSLDANKDGQLTDAEVNANPNVVQQIQQKETQVSQISQPIVMAQYYAIEQLLADYENVAKQVAQQKKFQIMLDPSAIQWVGQSIDVTADLVAAMNQRMPSVQSTPPANWQPTRRETVALHQTIQQVLLAAAQQQAMQAAQQQQQPAAQQPAAQQPSGR